MMSDLARNPILIQELETRSKFPKSYQGFLYEGPARSILMLGIPVMASLGAWFLTSPGRNTPGGPTPYLLFLSTVLYTLYLAYAAARLAGGSIAFDRQNQGASYLRIMPLSAWDIYVGKFIGSLLPLFVEVAMVCPMLIVLCLLGWGPMSSALSVTAFLFGVVIWYGAWGMFWSSRSATVDQALNRSIMTVTVMMYVLPIAGMIFGTLATHPPLQELGIDLNPLVCLYTAVMSVASDPASMDKVPLEVGTMVAGTLMLVMLTLRQLRHDR